MVEYYMLAQTPRYVLGYPANVPLKVHNLFVWDKNTNECYDVKYHFEQKSVVNRLTITRHDIKKYYKSLNDKVPKTIVGAIYDVVNKEFYSRQTKDFMVELVS